MFQDQQVIGVLLAVAIMIASIWMVIKYTKALVAQEKILFLLVFILTILSVTWFIDRVIAFKTPLLTEKESDLILDIMKTIVTLVLGYYLGSKKTDINDK